MKAPSKTNKYYIHVDGGGYNRCIKISGNDCLPNCVGYAYGRFMEMHGMKSCSLPRINAEDWFASAKKLKFKTGSTPEVGAVMVFSKGNVGVDYDGAGHVLVVEKVSKKSITCSQSGYGASRWWTSTFKKPYKLTGYKFLGFIYCEYAGKKPTKTAKLKEKGTNVERLQSFLNWFGNYGLSVDGNFGSKTETALKKFQKIAGVKATGLLDEATLNIIEEKY